MRASPFHWKLHRRIHVFAQAAKYDLGDSSAVNPFKFGVCLAGYSEGFKASGHSGQVIRALMALFSFISKLPGAPLKLTWAYRRTTQSPTARVGKKICSCSPAIDVACDVAVLREKK